MILDAGRLAWSFCCCAEGFTSLVLFPTLPRRTFSTLLPLAAYALQAFCGEPCRCYEVHWNPLDSSPQSSTGTSCSCLLLRILVWKYTRVACLARAEQEDSVLTQIANLCVQRGEHCKENGTRRGDYLDGTTSCWKGSATSGESDPTESFILVGCDVRPCAVHLPCSCPCPLSLPRPSDGGIERASEL